MHQFLDIVVIADQTPNKHHKNFMAYSKANY